MPINNLVNVQATWYHARYVKIQEILGNCRKFFLWLALQKVDLRQIPAIVSSLKFEYLLLMCISLTLEHVTRAWRWQMILANRPSTSNTHTSVW